MSVLSGKFRNFAAGTTMLLAAALPFNANAQNTQQYYLGPNGVALPVISQPAQQNNQVSPTGVALPPQVAASAPRLAAQQNSSYPLYIGGVNEVRAHTARHPQRVGVAVTVGQGAPVSPYTLANIAYNAVAESRFVGSDQVDVFLEVGNNPEASGAAFEIYTGGNLLKGGSTYPFTPEGVKQAAQDIGVVRGWSSQVSSLDRHY